MKPVGYAWQHEIYCEGCLPVAVADAAVLSIFSYEASDYPLHCITCEAFLGGSITQEGLDRIRDRVVAGWRDLNKLSTYYGYYYECDQDFDDHVFCLWTFVGRRDALGNVEDLDDF